MCEQTSLYLFVQCILQPDLLHEQTHDPPTITCSSTALIAICEPLYHASHPLRVFLATPGATPHTPSRYPQP